MKKIIIITSLFFATIQMQAQSIQRSVIGSAGNVTTSGNIMLSSTVGEALTQTLSSSTNQITQGFQQVKRVDSTTFYLLCYLEGYYAGSYFMRPVLFNQGRSTDTTMTDSITVELHPAANPSMIAAEVKTILYRNANASCMMHVNNGDYYVVVKHRNHIETWSANPVSFNGTFAYHDFTWAANQAYGNNQIEIEPGVFALHSGDINQDENVDLLDASILETDINAFQFGYFATDLNGDGNVDLLDAPIVEENINNFVFASHP